VSGIRSIAGGAALSDEELRVLGCLLEKQRTTPEQYPLSLNALRLACNQSTNRDPVVAYDEATIRDVLHRLERRRLVRFASGSRAAKYRHLLEEALPLEEDERAVMTVLLLRGAQTPGELKQRTERMHAFADLEAVNDALARLIERELVLRLERRPGQKEERYRQLLGDAGEGETGDHRARAERDVAGEAPGDAREGRDGAAPAAPESSLAARLDALGERVARLEREVATLRNPVGDATGEDSAVEGSADDDAASIDDASTFDPRR
jgi:uncharacterized protein